MFLGVFFDFEVMEHGADEVQNEKFFFFECRETSFESLIVAGIEKFREVLGNKVVIKIPVVGGEAETDNGLEEPEQQVGLDLGQGWESILGDPVDKQVVVLVDHPAVVETTNE